MGERRKEQRRLAYIGARASFFRGQSSADVLIRNMSPSGVKLVVLNGSFLPEHFNLMIAAWQTEYRVRTCWRRYDQIGVKFEQAPAF
jgi:hypothetical protein